MKQFFLGASVLSLALSCLVTLPACDNRKAAPDMREDEGGDEPAPKPQTEAGDDEVAADADSAATKAADAPRPGTAPERAPAGDGPAGDVEAKGELANKPDEQPATGADTVKKANDTKGDASDVVGATPMKSDKRGAGSGPEGQCPCVRGFVCCDGVCKKSCD